jgi:ribosomal protein S19E (S16A)
VEEIRKAILKFKSLGRTDVVQKLQQELDSLEKISKNLDWKRYEKILREQEDRPDKEDFYKE